MAYSHEARKVRAEAPVLVCLYGPDAIQAAVGILGGRRRLGLYIRPTDVGCLTCFKRYPIAQWWLPPSCFVSDYVKNDKAT